MEILSCELVDAKLFRGAGRGDQHSRGNDRTRHSHRSRLRPPNPYSHHNQERRRCHLRLARQLSKKRRAQPSRS
jgi:hypothetical protein